MRTKHCRLLGHPTCLSVMPVRLCFSERSATELFEVGGELLAPSQMDAFAQADGFESVEDMAQFWWAEHPPEEGDRIAFEGVLISWQPLDAAVTLQEGAHG